MTSLMEALACGLPCLVSDIPANKEWVVENENGWLFHDGDVNALVGKMLTVIAQREKLPGVSRASRRSAEMRADWKTHREELLKFWASGEYTTGEIFPDSKPWLFVCGRPGTVPWAARQFDRARSGGDRDRRPGGMLSV